jgi:hypothetical protein
VHIFSEQCVFREFECNVVLLSSRRWMYALSIAHHGAHHTHHATVPSNARACLRRRADITADPLRGSHAAHAAVAGWARAFRRDQERAGSADTAS